ncbi:MAG: thioredoxin family protein [Clostridium sp.]|jgi:glutaredoxin|nr:thioredoxin family protein [Clostridium sp.]
MKKVVWFHYNGCPFCRRAEQALKELTAENPAYASVEIERIEENEHPEIAEKYDYYGCPSTFIDGVKLYEATIRDDDAVIRAGIKRTLDAALAG